MGAPLVHKLTRPGRPPTGGAPSLTSFRAAQRRPPPSPNRADQKQGGPPARTRGPIFGTRGAKTWFWYKGGQGTRGASETWNGNGGSFGLWSLRPFDRPPPPRPPEPGIGGTSPHLSGDLTKLCRRNQVPDTSNRVRHPVPPKIHPSRFRKSVTGATETRNWCAKGWFGGVQTARKPGSKRQKNRVGTKVWRFQLRFQMIPPDQNLVLDTWNGGSLATWNLTETWFWLLAPQEWGYFYGSGEQGGPRPTFKPPLVTSGSTNGGSLGIGVLERCLTRTDAT